MNKTLAAWTGSGNYPPYFNVSQDGDEVIVTVRSPADEDGNCGGSAWIRLPIAEFNDILGQMS